MSALKSADLFSDGSFVRVLIFDIEQAEGKISELAINIQKIREIVDLSEFRLTPLASSYYPIVGLLNLRGLSIPVLDLNCFLANSGHTMFNLKAHQRIIVCEFQRLHLGIIVDKTHKIRQFENSLVQKIPDVVAGLKNNVMNGIIELEGKFIELLDIEFILTKLNVDVAPEAPFIKSLDLKGKTVLIVEDSRLFQKKLFNFFKSKGAEIILAEDGIQGLEKLAGAVLPDLIFTDIEMPRLNGIGMVRKIKQDSKLKHIPVIFNTSISNQGLIEDINSEGLGDYIVKFNEQEIHNALSKCFKEHS